MENNRLVARYRSADGGEEIDIVTEHELESPLLDGWGRMLTKKNRRYREGHEQLDVDQIEAAAKAARERGAFVFPLYRLEHGRTVFNMAPFNDSWDSGRCGVYIVEPSDAGDDDAEKVAERVAAQLEAYTAYVNGEGLRWIRYRVQECEKGHEHREETAFSGEYLGTTIDDSGILRDMPDVSTWNEVFREL